MGFITKEGSMRKRILGVMVLSVLLSSAAGGAESQGLVLPDETSSHVRVEGLAGREADHPVIRS